MKFQVPQFVEIEDKIFWKLTLKQFIYVAGGGGLSLVIYLTTPFFLAVLLIIPVAAFSLALAFYKFNNRPFIFLVESATKYIFNPRLYIWKKEDQPDTETKSPEKINDDPTAGLVPKLSSSKLKELTWSLDTKENLNPVTRSDESDS